MYGATFHPWVFKMCIVKVLIRLCKCAGWSESLLGAHVRRYVFWRAVWSEPSLGAVWRAKDVKFLHADNENWAYFAVAQAYFSALLARTSEGTISHAAANDLDWFLTCNCPIYWGLAPTCYALCATYIYSQTSRSPTPTARLPCRTRFWVPRKFFRQSRKQRLSDRYFKIFSYFIMQMYVVCTH